MGVVPVFVRYEKDLGLGWFDLWGFLEDDTASKFGFFMSMQEAFIRYLPIAKVEELLEGLPASPNVLAIKSELSDLVADAEEAYSNNREGTPYDKEKLDFLRRRALEMKDLLERRDQAFWNINPLCS